jgi:DNA-binding beta-propeller fold protein YncE
MNLLRSVFFLLLSFSLAKAQTYNGPESIEFDPNDGNYFVGNAGDGTMVKLTPGGTLTTFAASITFPTGPHGLELIADTLYACDGSNLKLIDRTTGTLIADIAMGATFLNGITHKGNNLYITDFSAKKIHRFNILTRQHNVFCPTLLGAKTPNGIIYDDINDRIVYCCWGTNAPVYTVSLTDSVITLLAGTVLGNCDGITMNCSGDFYISSWSQNRVTKFTHTMASPTTFIGTGLSSPADIYYNRLQDTLYVPNSGTGNNVSKKGDVSCLVALPSYKDVKQLPVLYPNPAAGTIRFRAEELEGEQECTISTIQGKMVWKGLVSPSNASVDLSNLEKGIYFVTLGSSAKAITYRLIKE